MEDCISYFSANFEIITTIKNIRGKKEREMAFQGHRVHHDGEGTA